MNNLSIKIKILTTLIIFSLGLLFVFKILPSPTQAACVCNNNLCDSSCVEAIAGRPCTNDWDCASVSDPNCGLCSAIFVVLKVLVPWVFGVGFIGALIYLVLGAISYITAGEDVKKITEARGKITWTIVSVVILILASAIVRLTWSFFGMEEDKIFVIPTNDDTIIDCTKCGSEFQ